MQIHTYVLNLQIKSLKSETKTKFVTGVSYNQFIEDLIFFTFLKKTLVLCVYMECVWTCVCIYMMCMGRVEHNCGWVVLCFTFPQVSGMKC